MEEEKPQIQENEEIPTVSERKELTNPNFTPQKEKAYRIVLFSVFGSVSAILIAAGIIGGIAYHQKETIVSRPEPNSQMGFYGQDGVFLGNGEYVLEGHALRSVSKIPEGATAFVLPSVWDSKPIYELGNGETNLFLNEVQSIEEVYCPAPLNRIKTGAFRASSLRKFSSSSIADYTLTIESFAFADNLNLEEVHLPLKLGAIEASAFAECPKLSSLDFGGSITQWESVNKDENWRLGSSLETIVCFDGTITL